MLVEKNLKEALKDYLAGRKVLVLWIDEKNSMNLSVLSELLEDNNNHFLVDVPAYENPEFKAEVDQMIVDGSGEPRPEPESEMVKDTEPARCENFVGGGTKPKEYP